MKKDKGLESWFKRIENSLSIIKIWPLIDIDKKHDAIERTIMISDLSQIIKELDELGFWVFGVRKEEIFKDNGKEVILSMAIFDIIRKTNDRITKISKNKD